MIARGELDWTDYTVSAHVRKSDRIPCVLARVLDSNNLYNLELTDTALVPGQYAAKANPTPKMTPPTVLAP